MLSGLVNARLKLTIAPSRHVAAAICIACRPNWAFALIVDTELKSTCLKVGCLEIAVRLLSERVGLQLKLDCGLTLNKPVLFQQRGKH